MDFFPQVGKDGSVCSTKVEIEHDEVCRYCGEPNGIWILCKVCSRRDLDLERWRDHAEEDGSWNE